MSLSVLSSVFTGNNQSGTGRLIGVGRTPRYNRISSGLMSSLGIRQALSSATVYASSTADATVIMFAPLLPFFGGPDYTGRFLQITNRRNAGSEFKVDRFSDFGFNNMATSILVAAPNRGTEFRMSFRDLFLAQWRAQIDAQLTDGARRNGDPTLTWEMWPNGINHLSSDHMYLKVHQRLRIELSWWPDYDASITYHLFLFLDGGGRLRGHVQRWAYWVESGIKASSIGDRLRPAVIAGMDKINDELAAQLDPFSGFSFRDLYYLPGNQTTRPPTGVLSGFTTSDVTIVVQL